MSEVKTMVRRHTDQMIRTRNFKVRNERVATGVLVETGKGKMTALKGKQERTVNGKHREMQSVSARTTVSVERKHNRPLPLQGRRHKMTEEDLRQEVHQEATVLQEGNIKARAEITS